MPSELVTYRQAVTASSAAIPTHIQRDRRAKEKVAQAAQERETKEPLLQALLEDMLTRPCEKCDAPVGGYCMTSTGNRAEVLHAARREASPIMMEHRHLFTEVKQPTDFTPDPEFYRKNPNHPGRRNFSPDDNSINDITPLHHPTNRKRSPVCAADSHDCGCRSLCVEGKKNPKMGHFFDRR